MLEKFTVLEVLVRYFQTIYSPEGQCKNILEKREKVFFFLIYNPVNP